MNWTKLEPKRYLISNLDLFLILLVFFIISVSIENGCLYLFQYWSLLPKLKNQKKSTKKKSEREGEEIATPPYPATKTTIHQRLHRKSTTKEAPIWRQTSRTRDHVLSCTGERSAEVAIRETRGVVFLKMAIYKCPKSLRLFFILLLLRADKYFLSSLFSLFLLAPTHPRHVRRIGHRSHTRVRVDSCWHGCAIVLDESEQHRSKMLW